MRIEKINDRQIRCTLNQKDLTSRDLKLSELAYGSDKAKSLFRDMLEQASYEFGFLPQTDVPLMVEAIPVNTDTLILLITLMDDPEELDARFSQFSPQEDTLTADPAYPFGEIEEISAGHGQAETPADPNHRQAGPGQTDPAANRDMFSVFSFHHMEELTDLAATLATVYHGQNTLYKDSRKGLYYLVAHKTGHTPEEFARVCNRICEYGTLVRNTYASASYYTEHFEPLIDGNAIQVLSSL